MLIALVIVVIVETSAVIYLLMNLRVENSKTAKLIPGQLVLIEKTIHETIGLLEENVRIAFNRTHAEIVKLHKEPVSEPERRIADLEAKLELASTANPPRCQFCNNILGKVARRADGYYCCPSCSVKHFGSAPSIS